VGGRRREAPGEGDGLRGEAGAAEGEERRGGGLGGEEGPLPRRARDGLQATREGPSGD